MASEKKTGGQEATVKGSTARGLPWRTTCHGGHASLRMPHGQTAHCHTNSEWLAILHYTPKERTEGVEQLLWGLERGRWYKAPPHLFWSHRLPMRSSEAGLRHLKRSTELSPDNHCFWPKTYNPTPSCPSSRCFQ